MIDERIYQQFCEIGRDLYTANMISSHGGNISIRVGDRVIIKRRGAQLGNLKPLDLIETGIAAKEREREHFLELAERLARSSDKEEQTRLKQELARLTFGE